MSSSERFTSRVADYVRYRPDYPTAATDLLADTLGLRPGSTAADIGAGTGLLTLPLLRTGAHVIAVDPNKEMLQAARQYLQGHDNVEIMVGTAEDTHLPPQSVDAVTAGQAFHWFDHDRARTEFQRVLKIGGRVALVWNTKSFDTSGFLAGYRRLLEQHVPEFAEVRHEKTGDAELLEFFGREPAIHAFPHEQRFDWQGVLGRVMSSSYAPQPGEKGHEMLISELRHLFDRHAADGEIAWPYTTKVYIGQL